MDATCYVCKAKRARRYGLCKDPACLNHVMKGFQMQMAGQHEPATVPVPVPPTPNRRPERRFRLRLEENEKQ
jgi:hypothetical protein